MVAQPGATDGAHGVSVTFRAAARVALAERCSIRAAGDPRANEPPGVAVSSRVTGSIGPMLEPFDTATTDACNAASAASPRAFEPDGPTQATTGTRERRIARSERRPTRRPRHHRS